jgi:hypothetical protein
MTSEFRAGGWLREVTVKASPPRPSIAADKVYNGGLLTGLVVVAACVVAWIFATLKAGGPWFRQFFVIAGLGGLVAAAVLCVWDAMKRYGWRRSAYARDPADVGGWLCVGAVIAVAAEVLVANDWFRCILGIVVAGGLVIAGIMRKAARNATVFSVTQVRSQRRPGLD